MTDLLSTRTEGRVRILTLNRPDKLNALNTELTAGLIDALNEADTDGEIAAIVLAGAGRAFCAGADLKEFSSLTAANPELVRHRAHLTYTLQSMLPGLRKPIVVAAQGAAVGGGAGLVAGADIAIAADDLKFGYPELQHGIVAALVMTGLTRAVGRKKAFEILALRRLLSAHEALGCGAINRIVSAADLLPAAIECAQRIAEVDPVAMATTKELFYRVAETPYAEAMRIGRDTNTIMRSFGGAAKGGR